ncbi:hypothetical protein QBC43DRAFT_310022 [Cladorrhinum sp. PSN259]|nr:hypothetical protein QBC43DRAFT_310022 [Cladorrhinum sp. PSN259]
MLLAGSRHSHRDSRPAGRGTTGTEKQPQQTIKTAMAAGLGSSLFIFRGLSSISSHILQEASRPSSSSSTSSSTTSRQSSEMGSCHSSPEDGARKGHRRAGSSESSQALLNPRPASHSQQQQQQQNHQQKHSRTYSRSPKPEYRLRLECADCKRRNVMCRIAPDLNCNGNTLAYASPLSHRSSSASAVAGKQQLKEWTLTVDFCGWTGKRETALQVLGKHMRINSSDVGEKSGSGREGSNGKPFRVDDLLEELDSRGVKYESCIPQDGQGAGAPVRGWERL